MENNLDLKNIERKIYSSYFNDGIWDIYGGLIISGFGLFILTGQVIVLILCILLALILVLIRKPIVMARLGSVKFSVERIEKTTKHQAIAWIAGFVVLIATVVFTGLFLTNNIPVSLDNWISNYFLVIFGGIFTVIICIAAYIISVKRYYIYALLVFMAFLLASILRSEDLEGIPITIAGLLVLCSGIVMLVRLLIKNTMPEKENL